MFPASVHVHLQLEAVVVWLGCRRQRTDVWGDAQVSINAQTIASIDHSMTDLQSMRMPVPMRYGNRASGHHNSNQINLCHIDVN